MMAPSLEDLPVELLVMIANFLCADIASVLAMRGTSRYLCYAVSGTTTNWAWYNRYALERGMRLSAQHNMDMATACRDYLPGYMRAWNPYVRWERTVATLVRTRYLRSLGRLCIMDAPPGDIQHNDVKSIVLYKAEVDHAKHLVGLWMKLGRATGTRCLYQNQIDKFNECRGRLEVWDCVLNSLDWGVE